MKSIYVSLVVIAVFSTSGCDEPRGQAVSQSSDNGSAQRAKCISQAKAQGYRDGACAHNFIETCINTQSRSKMEEVLRTDAMLGTGSALSCPNMPTTYSAEFDHF